MNCVLSPHFHRQSPMENCDNELVIAAVQKAQALYDRTHKLHANRQFLHQAWKDIGQELNIDGAVAKKKWTSLRDYFQRQHREMTAFKSGPRPSKKKKWPLYDSMTFLVPYVNDRPAPSNLSEINDLELNATDTVSQSSTEVPSIHSPVQKEDVTVSAVETPPGLEDAEVEQNTPASKRHFSCATRKRSAQVDIDIQREILDTLRTIPTALYVPPQEEDEDLLFFKSMIPKIKALDVLQKMELQAEMHSVLFKHLKRARATATEPTKYAVNGRARNV
ncbi:uncharacterized protein LOC101859047 [Aplysia californica]|uniref:Uncharacterized protein LOC101859047 n=1 Tax=Aplysia californica TaxID=6500 RepID=A0ABM0K559_APLCA|nr:uncharacterized protein LOC101859047 [Aplysia californica]